MHYLWIGCIWSALWYPPDIFWGFEKETVHKQWVSSVIRYGAGTWIEKKTVNKLQNTTEIEWATLENEWNKTPQNVIR